MAAEIIGLDHTDLRACRLAMAAWHLLNRPDWAALFTGGDPAAQKAMLAKILRLEPVSGILTRRKLRRRAASLSRRAAGTARCAPLPDAPGLRLASLPQTRWFRPTTSYELHAVAIARERT